MDQALAVHVYSPLTPEAEAQSQFELYSIDLPSKAILSQKSIIVPALQLSYRSIVKKQHTNIKSQHGNGIKPAM